MPGAAVTSAIKIRSSSRERYDFQVCITLAHEAMGKYGPARQSLAAAQGVYGSFFRLNRCCRRRCHLQSAPRSSLSLTPADQCHQSSESSLSSQRTYSRLISSCVVSEIISPRCARLPDARVSRAALTVKVPPRYVAPDNYGHLDRWAIFLMTQFYQRPPKNNNSAIIGQKEFRRMEKIAQ